MLIAEKEYEVSMFFLNKYKNAAKVFVFCAGVFPEKSSIEILFSLK